MKKSDLGDLPVPRCEPGSQKAVVALVQQRLDEEARGADGAATEQLLDAAVADLFGLTPRQLERTRKAI